MINTNNKRYKKAHQIEIKVNQMNNNNAEVIDQIITKTNLNQTITNKIILKAWDNSIKTNVSLNKINIISIINKINSNNTNNITNKTNNNINNNRK